MTDPATTITITLQQSRELTEAELTAITWNIAEHINYEVKYGVGALSVGVKDLDAGVHGFAAITKVSADARQYRTATEPA